MTNVLTISGAPAGVGNRIQAVIAVLAKGTGTYAINNANFPGIGPFQPGMFFIATGTPANVTLQISDGSAGKQVYGAGGGLLWCDGIVGGTATGAGTQVAGALKLVIATAATDLFFCPIGW